MSNQSEDSFDSLFEEERSGMKIFAVIFLISMLVLSGIYAYLSIGAVRDQMALAKSQAEGIATVNPELLDLMKEKAWAESRLKMADADSVGLSIDLKKQVIQLELKGVVVMKSKIMDCHTSGFFRKMDGNVYFSMFGSPLEIREFESTIEKNPFKVVKAPKNAEEAEAAAAQKDSIPDEIVFWTVKFDRNFELNIQGVDSILESKEKNKFAKNFEFERDLKNIVKSFDYIKNFTKPVYTPEILISIDEGEARAILRALPKKKALVTIRI